MEDFYDRVPGDYWENLEYRKTLSDNCNKDIGYRRAATEACREDVLYFFASHCWLYEPRVRFLKGKKLPKIVPFIPWPHQEPVIRKMRARLGGDDIGDVGLLKSRGEGASWIGVLLAMHDWIFQPLTAVGLVSRTELAGDNPTDPDSLFWKIDWELSKLPAWMVGLQEKDWKRDKSKHTLLNLRNNSYITSYACGGDVATGGRKLWFLMDELAKWPRGPDKEAFASTEPVCDSRLIISTPKGAHGAYYDCIHEPSSMLQLKLHWSDNETRNRGLYKLVDNKAMVVDPTNQIPTEYKPASPRVLDLWSRLRRKGFVLEKKLRSPWYDERCDRPGQTPEIVAQEYDLDFGGSDFQIFGGETMDAVEPHLRAPLLIGAVDYDKEKLVPHFEKVANGECRLWCKLDAKGKPPKSSYVIGCDVGTGQGGTYTTNSTIIVIDSVLGEQVGEIASNIIEPFPFADLAIAICNLFHGALLAWEHAGPGTAFTKRVLERKYMHYYERQVLSRRRKTKQRAAGWVPSPENKEAMFADLKTALRMQDLIIRSRPMFAEMSQYLRMRGKIEHTGAVNTADPNAAGENHGDRVTGLGVAWVAVKSRPAFDRAVLDGPNPEDRPTHCPASRLKKVLDQRIRENDEWDDRGPAELNGSVDWGGNH